MNLITKVKDVIGAGNSLEIHLYECQNCGNQFESAKDPEKAKCMNCLSTNITDLGNPK